MPLRVPFLISERRVRQPCGLDLSRFRCFRHLHWVSRETAGTGFIYRPGGGAQRRDAVEHTILQGSGRGAALPVVLRRALSVEPELERRPPAGQGRNGTATAGGHAFVLTSRATPRPAEIGRD